MQKKLRENESKWSRYSNGLEFKRPIIGNVRCPKIESEFEPKYTSRYVSDCFSEFIKEEGRDLLPYFKLLSNIYHFISTKADEEALFYARFIRPRLSEPELSFIFYYGASIYGMPISKTLMERFCIVEYMRADRVFSEESLEKFDLAAFGRNSEVYGVFGKKIRSWQTADLKQSLY